MAGYLSGLMRDPNDAPEPADAPEDEHGELDLT
jgi:hypothetical protein